MLSVTLEAGLSDYAIGAKIRALRLKKKMGLVELGQHSGLSPALLSKLERGRLFPTLPTLLRIALVFSVGLDYFFAGAREKPLVAVVRKAERVQLPERQDGKDMSYRFESLDYPATERRFNWYYAEFLPLERDNVRLHTHAGVEFIYTLKGRLDVHIDGQEYALESGDSCISTPAFPMATAAAAPQVLRHRGHDSLIGGHPPASPSSASGRQLHLSV